eukprot:665047_1
MLLKRGAASGWDGRFHSIDDIIANGIRGTKQLNAIQGLLNWSSVFEDDVMRGVIEVNRYIYFSKRVNFESLSILPTEWKETIAPDGTFKEIVIDLVTEVNV